ncbi:DUF4082 domain-containing protein [Paenibacillus spongiae]|uniref:DUF4082 domain-containing protein n=1 Tax=Paenibacillus spongiae TaxID=2909671 RepID=A0ABY5SLH8_9BACL|nr:DUF4082 domain-containing protein [Paenibacillus spongiae]UVI33375.1 DUF4082 domain-containing protein [Paenibacillus spongiae]
MDPQYASALADAGVTMVRQSSILMWDIVPQTTINDYLNNVNNVQDPSTWNWNPSNNMTETMPESDVAAFQNEGIKVFSILAGVPAWLSYNDNAGGMPKNWWVYEDIIGKLYQHYQDRIDYFELFNEPEIELAPKLAGSGYSDLYTAYRDLYYHGMIGIKRINPNFSKPVGGPVAAYTDNYTWLNNMLGDADIKNDVGFASWHRYDVDSTNDVGISNWENAAARNGRPDLPMFVTEYNNPYVGMETADVISYIGGKLSVLMDKGATGAFLYGTDDRADGLNAAVRHDWYIIRQDGTLTPRLWPIRLLSKQLKLGLGQNKMKKTSTEGVTGASAAINANGNPVVWAVNDSTSAVSTDVVLNNLGLSSNVTLSHYLASASNDADSVYLTEKKKVLKNSVSTTITLPPKSVYGIIVEKKATPPVNETIMTTQTPENFSSDARYELGTKFKTKVNGKIAKVRIYTNGIESGDHTVSIWNANGTRVWGPYVWTVPKGKAGWKELVLQTPLHITANTDYIVSVSNSTDNLYPVTLQGFNYPINNQDLITYSTSGLVGTTVGEMPTLPGYQNANYFRDIVFVPSGTSGFAPEAPANLTASEGISQVYLKWTASGGASNYTVSRSTSNGGPYSPVKGCSSISTTTCSDDAGLIGGTTYYYVVTAMNSFGISGSSNQTSAIPLSSGGEPVTIMTSQTPDVFNNEAQYELGTKFKSNVNGQITKVRIYTNGIEAGDHTVRIWRVSDSSVVAGPYTWNVSAGSEGWKEFTLPIPLGITADTDYIVSVSNSTDFYYAYKEFGFDSPINNGNLITYTGSGMAAVVPGTMPSIVYHNGNYFRDVVFVPAISPQSP